MVYKARQLELDRIVALKVMHSSDNGQEQCAHFRREAEAAARLQHPHIVQIYQVGEQDEWSYLSMEYVAGGCLADRLDGKPLPEHDAARLLEQLARAMDFAHQRGVVHRDLKPANVLLARSDRRDPDRAPLGLQTTSSLEPKITDFGLAKRCWEGDWRETRTGAILGTPGYMAPEQATGKTRDVGPAADTYALGTILYELITGRAPFQAATLLETLEQVRSQEPVSPTRLRPRLSRDLETICLKCLQKEPAARYASAQDLADDLQRFLAHEPIRARPISPLERTGKWARRRPLIAALLMGIVSTTLLGFTGVLWQWNRAEQRREGLENALIELGKSRQAEQAQREKVEASLYFHRIALAHREWSSGHALRTAELLKQCSDDRHRGWEYDYLYRLFHPQMLTLQGHRLGVWNVTYSPDGKLIASASARWASDDDGEVIIWDASTGRQRCTLHGHPGPIMGLAFSPDGQRLASSGGSWSTPQDSRVKIWDTATGQEVQELSDDTDYIFSVAFSPDGRRVAAGTAGGVRVWELADGSVVWSSQAHRATVVEVDYSPDGRLLASAGYNDAVLIWDAETGQPLHTLSGASSFRTLDFSPDGRLFVAGSWGRIVKLWDVAAGFEELATHHLLSGKICRIRFYRDSRCLALASEDSAIRLLDAITGQELRVLLGHNSSSYGVAFSPDGQVLASCGHDRTVKLWDLTADPDPVAFQGHSAYIAAMAISPEASLLALAGTLDTADYRGENTVRILAIDGRQTVCVLRGHQGWLTSVAFSPEGQRVATGSEDQTVKVWDVSSGALLLNVEGHTDVVTGVAFSPDGARIASASQDGTIRVWDRVFWTGIQGAPRTRRCCQRGDLWPEWTTDCIGGRGSSEHSLGRRNGPMRRDAEGAYRLPLERAVWPPRPARRDGRKRPTGDPLGDHVRRGRPSGHVPSADVARAHGARHGFGLQSRRRAACQRGPGCVHQDLGRGDRSGGLLAGP